MAISKASSAAAPNPKPRTPNQQGRNVTILEPFHLIVSMEELLCLLFAVLGFLVVASAGPLAGAFHP